MNFYNHIDYQYLLSRADFWIFKETNCFVTANILHVHVFIQILLWFTLLSITA